MCLKYLMVLLVVHPASSGPSQGGYIPTIYRVDYTNIQSVSN